MNAPPTIPDITLERYRLNELPAAEAKRVQRLLLTDERLQGRLAALLESDEAIRAERTPAELASGIAARLKHDTTPGASRSRLAMGWALTAAGVVVLAALVVRPGAPSPVGPSSVLNGSDTSRIKGLEATLAIYRRTDAGSELLADGDRARPGDLLRIGYKVAKPGYGLILSVDGRGVVTRHLPPDGERAVALTTGDTVLLDRAYELDDAPEWERFYFVTAPTPFEIEPVLSALRTAAPIGKRQPALGPELGHVTFSIQKDTRP